LRHDFLSSQRKRWIVISGHDAKANARQRHFSMSGSLQLVQKKAPWPDHSDTMPKRQFLPRNAVWADSPFLYG